MTGGSGTGTSSQGARPKSIEETYQKLSQLEHVLLRPDTYIGSTQRTTEKLWVLADAEVADGATVRRMLFRDVSYVPGLYKIFDEVLVNAADHKQRDPSLNEIRVDVDAENTRITVFNNGSGIPIEIHSKEGCYVPELIFGHLLTSSNYDDEERKVTGGRNGYGAKLANIFSTEFVVETADGRHHFVQVFRSNMQQCGSPQIRACSPKENFTRISFVPDLPKFGMDALDTDTLALMEKRVYDIAGCNPGVKVYWNGIRLPVRSFRDYVQLYTADREETNFIYEQASERWEVALAPSDGQFMQVSFVNSIWTIKGGNHVNAVADQVVNAVLEHLTRKHKNLKVKPFQVRNHLWLFVRCLIENPAFDSQTKENMTSRPHSFGSRCELSAEFIRKLLRSDIIGHVLEFARFRQDAELKKTDGGKRQRVLGIPKLDDANKAGTRESEKCTLILTEGDSAKALAISGLSVVGRDYYGVFPLRGKLLNVREATHKQIMENAEINHLKKILGLQHGKVYDTESVRQLRYGHVMIMTDQDHDGSHIKGLLVNFFHHFWPSLLHIPGFLLEFITPIVKASFKRNDRTEELVFFTIPEYQQWRRTQRTLRGWTIKYYKGLGTSTAAEARTYFSNLARHQIPFVWQSSDDNDSIELAFSKHKVQERKDWLAAHELGTYFDHATDTLTFSNFVHKELVLFSLADNARSIPCLVDGLKPSQRKVLFASFKRKLYQEIKVAQLAGYVSEHAAYHHGEASLMATIIGLAQNFVGSNNLNLLVPAGQFGTRLQGGKDAASPRYIFTCLAPVTRALFPEADDVLLEYLEEDGLSIEPKWYCPVVPLVLINGAEGIGTGWSTNIPCHNPRDLIRILKAMLTEADETVLQREAETLTPWYRGFQGSIVAVPNSPANYEVFGRMFQLPDGRIRIRELPLRTWTQSYKEWLEAHVVGNLTTSTSSAHHSTGSSSSSSTSANGGGAQRPFLKEFADNSTETLVDFTLNWANPAELEQADACSLFKRLRLIGSLSTSNMVLFDSNGLIRRYEGAQQVLLEFYRVRFDLYRKRQEWIVEALGRELVRLDNKVRFILAVIHNEIVISNRKRSELLLELQQRGFAPLTAGHGTAKTANTSAAATDVATPGDEHTSSDQGNNSSNNQSSESDPSGYDYLLSMPLWSLTKERVDELRRQRDEKAKELERMRATRPTALWMQDLEQLEQVLHTIDAEMALEAQGAARASRAPSKAGRGRQTKSSTTIIEDDSLGTEVAPPQPRAAAVRRSRVQNRPPSADAVVGHLDGAEAGASQSASTSASTLVSAWEATESDAWGDDSCGPAESSGAARSRIKPGSRAIASDQRQTSGSVQRQRAPKSNPASKRTSAAAACGTARDGKSITRTATDDADEEAAVRLSTRAEQSLSERLASRLHLADTAVAERGHQRVPPAALPNSRVSVTASSEPSHSSTFSASDYLDSLRARLQAGSRSMEPTPHSTVTSQDVLAPQRPQRARRPPPRVLVPDSDEDEDVGDQVGAETPIDLDDDDDEFVPTDDDSTSEADE
jgi:DNA topoisomerase-2